MPGERRGPASAKALPFPLDAPQPRAHFSLPSLRRGILHPCFQARSSSGWRSSSGCSSSPRRLPPFSCSSTGCRLPGPCGRSLAISSIRSRVRSPSIRATCSTAPPRPRKWPPPWSEMSLPTSAPKRSTSSALHSCRVSRRLPTCNSVSPTADGFGSRAVMTEASSHNVGSSRPPKPPTPARSSAAAPPVPDAKKSSSSSRMKPLMTRARALGTRARKGPQACSSPMPTPTSPTRPSSSPPPSRSG